MSRRRDSSRKANNPFKRKVDIRKARDSFLIVCEGEKTEPNYFRKFHGPIDVKVEGTGCNTISLVEKAVEIRDERQKEGEVYDQVWCVFDKDSFSDDNFNQAKKLAENNNIRPAYSNEAFELWYLLHFGYHQAATSRNDYGKMLSKKLNFSYRKNDPGIYEVLAKMQAHAIKNAEHLLKSYDPHNPAKNNPCTTVHLLVQELLKSGPGFKN